MSQLEFVNTSDVELGFEPVLEAWLHNHLLADLRRVNGEWRVQWFSDTEVSACSWEIFRAVYCEFERFVYEMSRR